MASGGSQLFEAGGLMISSEGRRWRGVFAEVRAHPAGEIPSFVTPVTTVSVHIRGPSLVTRQSDGVWQQTEATPGTIWICPVGTREDFVETDRHIDEFLHIYLAPSVFVSLGERVSRRLTDSAVGYLSGFRDPLMERISSSILEELRCETSSGDILVETLADSLAARLFGAYSSPAPPLKLGDDQPTSALDDRRLKRVLDFIEANVAAEITVEDLASAASLSRFHFSRMFKAATGQSPSSYIGQRRFNLAKSLLKVGGNIAQVAHECGFSSESNFVRSFRRVSGETPGQYRDRTRF